MPNPIVGCNVTKCVHNMNGNQCMASDISIFNDEATGKAHTYSQTQCEAFEVNTLGNMVTAMGNTNVSGAVTSMVMDGTQLTPKVKCYVNHCVHWASGNMCEASSIQVDGSSASQKSDTDCKTFAKRTGA